MAISELSIKEHRKNRGKFAVRSRMPIKNREQLSIAYTPGVGAVSSAIAGNPRLVYELTSKANMVAVVSDGSAVLGLGNIGPLAALPVMEGKAALFSELANIDAVPIVLDTQNEDEIIAAVKAIAPTFGGINLEDISAPRCFYIEDKLRLELKIPVFHDDQHGTAMVVLAGLTNALRVVGKEFSKAKITINGAGAAGTAITRLLIAAGARRIIVLDSSGIIYSGRQGLTGYKSELSRLTNPDFIKGDLANAITGADVFIGVSKGNLVTESMVRSMASDSIIFAMANPVPEIMPNEAIKAGAAIVASGRSDYPNQINNVLVFPGFFRGLLDSKILDITQAMQLGVAKALANIIKNPRKDRILPDVFDKKVVKTIAAAVKQ